MIKAIVFDCFGVLATDGWLPFRSQHFKDNKELYTKADGLNKDMNTGSISYQSFVNQVAKLAGVTEKFLDSQIDSNVANVELLDFIKKELKPKYKLGILSNAGVNWLDVIFTKDQLSIFDALALSYEMGAIKPDLITYQTVADRLGVDPTECIFVDDQEKHCIGAIQAGMKAVIYIDFKQTKSELQSLLK
jgi:FMN phosphatase YigB (HAD superfamily)